MGSEIATEHSAAFKYYIALLCHPFNACEIFLNHIELELTRDGKVSDHSIRILSDIAARVQSPRISGVFELLSAKPRPFVNKPSPDRIQRLFNLNARQLVCVDFSDASVDRTRFSDALSPLLDALARMRNTRYPNVDDFNVVTMNAFKWRFTDAGRLLNALLTFSLHVTATRA